MKSNPRLVAMALVVIGAALAAGYIAGRKSAAPGSAAPSAAALAPEGRTAQRDVALVPGHPPVGQAAPAQDQPREGKVEVDPARKFVHFRVGDKNVKRIFVDGTVIWVGTSGGAVRYDTASDEYKLFDAHNGLLSNGVFHVGKVQGRIVLGTYGGGMALFDAAKQSWESYNIPDGLGDAFVYDVLEARNGDIWIATWSGVNVVRGGALKDRSKWDLHTVQSTNGGLPNDWVYALAEGKNGDIWLATEGGLARYRAGNWQNWNHAKGLGADYERVKDDIAYKSDPSLYSEHHARQKEEMGLQKINVAYNPNYIVALVVDRDGVVWAGTWGAGLSRFDGENWKTYTVAEGLPGNHVFMLHLDPRGTLWVGTNNGLAKLRAEEFTVMTTADGLFANTVFSMASGPEGSIWVGSYGGVAKIALSEQ